MMEHKEDASEKHKVELSEKWNEEGKLFGKSYKIRNSRFPMSTFFVTLGAFLLISGFHTGLIVAVNKLQINGIVQIMLVISYWVLVSVAFALFTRWQMKETYEKPLKEMAEATAKVAGGDFSVYVPLLHTPEKLDYLDVMIMDFNKMVGELGSIETLKTDFFSNVSHEIKTPIAVIQNSAELLRTENLSEEERQEYVTTIIQSSKKLSALITNILKLNKLEKQSIQPVLEEFDLCRQLCDCSLQFEQVWEEKNIEFEVDLSEDEQPLLWDESLLELVWTNLLSNAFKFTPDGGTVQLKQFSDEGEITVQVIDSGCGMDSETAKHIFDKFYQGDTSHHSEGNGLGLALALRIVRMAEGKISVESEPGVGTTFTVKLPKRNYEEAVIEA